MLEDKTKNKKGTENEDVFLNFLRSTVSDLIWVYMLRKIKIVNIKDKLCKPLRNHLVWQPTTKELNPLSVQIAFSQAAATCLLVLMQDSLWHIQIKKERKEKERERRGEHAVKGRQMGLSVMYIVTHLPVTAPWECSIINTEKWKVGIKLKKNPKQTNNPTYWTK